MLSFASFLNYSSRRNEEVQIMEDNLIQKMEIWTLSKTKYILITMVSRIQFLLDFDDVYCDKFPNKSIIFLLQPIFKKSTKFYKYFF